jgi:hypothetical protein
MSLQVPSELQVFPEPQLVGLHTHTGMPPITLQLGMVGSGQTIPQQRPQFTAHFPNAEHT